MHLNKQPNASRTKDSQATVHFEGNVLVAVFSIDSAFIFSTICNGTLVSLHVSEVGCPAADAASGSGPEPQPPAPTQSAQCNAVKVGPAERRSHPGKRMQTSYKQYNMSANICVRACSLNRH